MMLGLSLYNVVIHNRYESKTVDRLCHIKAVRTLNLMDN